MLEKERLEVECLKSLAAQVVDHAVLEASEKDPIDISQEERLNFVTTSRISEEGGIDFVTLQGGLHSSVDEAQPVPLRLLVIFRVPSQNRFCLFDGSL